MIMFRELITWAKTNKPNCLPTRLSAIFYDFIEYRGVFPVIGHHFAPWSPFLVNVRKLPLVTENTLRAKVKILLLFLCVGNSKCLVHLVSTKVRVCSPPRWVSSGSAKFTLAQRELAIPKVSGNTPSYSSVIIKWRRYRRLSYAEVDEGLYYSQRWTLPVGQVLIYFPH